LLPPACSWALPSDPPSPALQSQTLLKDQLELVRLKQADGSTRFSIKPIEAEFSFDKGFFIFIRAIQSLTQHNKDITLVGRRRRPPGAAMWLLAWPPALPNAPFAPQQPQHSVAEAKI
jgi:hypothetical protein